ncbi:ChbG/HpnK family deacetylase [Francisella philomiragia]|uniref:ChbG/HpnK family deacetylase n=1 Tax=Francisella philomiragia TaxID=28110 RepID=UPI001908742C|nr:ChbG/HpnK family deacetylase [Francisella philomiragia]MBK2094006.1 ChbG/HpnK family deacetylase [Francisella philomiragia]MBK2256476.1 ChbG/HpnK family deacetylase [Francisella philomiragia]MBK2269134.1 ChbG/HpnK family deacetylase [Francisella philomiragia]MBK2270392.1 ChbG/HpnK family deacetylase [Francisella philomiragia]MBK2274171.1 ChbG/HpnK family deacetylase [Francisella philomiragia]
MSKKIIICADDFGMSQNINNAIVELLKKNIINATSCMTNMPEFKQGISELKRIYNNSINVGIHLNLTEGTPFTEAKSLVSNDSFIPVSKLLIKSQLRFIKYKDVYNELKYQIKYFIDNWGNLPDFIDGHQHVHHFPIIRKALVSLYKEFNMYNKQTYIRSTYNMSKPDFKSKVIYYSGAKKLNKMLVSNNLKHNTSFAGVYSLESSAEDFQKVINHAYKNIQDGGIIMCHPAKAIDKNDPIGKSRLREYKYFKSAQALDDQKNNNIVL